MRTNRSFAAALAVVLLTTMVCLGGCGKPNPLAPPETHSANPPVVVDSCFLELTTPDPPNVIPGNDSYLGAPGAKSPIVETVVFGGDSSTVEVRWRITTVGTASTTKYNFSVLAVDKATGSSVKGDLGNGRTNIDFGNRQVDTLVTSRRSSEPVAGAPSSSEGVTSCTPRGTARWPHPQAPLARHRLCATKPVPPGISTASGTNAVCKSSSADQHNTKSVLLGTGEPSIKFLLYPTIHTGGAFLFVPQRFDRVFTGSSNRWR